MWTSVYNKVSSQLVRLQSDEAFLLQVFLLYFTPRLLLESVVTLHLHVLTIVIECILVYYWNESKRNNGTIVCFFAVFF